ncbi:hypothetical protein FMO003_34980 [Moritella sp. F3]|nr:hypothetical protein FMO001_19810 [Moritella sp. F1]GIC83218.1 hypothetical protein FMO003_34980 [Moritella sp. F3]
MVEIKYRNPSKGGIWHIAIDSTGLKVFGEGNRKLRSTVMKSVERGVNSIQWLMLIRMRSFCLNDPL